MGLDKSEENDFKQRASPVTAIGDWPKRKTVFQMHCDF